MNNFGQYKFDMKKFAGHNFTRHESEQNIFRMNNFGQYGFAMKKFTEDNFVQHKLRRNKFTPNYKAKMLQ
jgi:hypothetical protein